MSRSLRSIAALALAALLLCAPAAARADRALNETLRAMIRAAHTYDILHYDLRVSLDPAERTGTVRAAMRIKGTRTPAPSSIQFVLHRALKVAAVSEEGRPLKHRAAAPMADYPGTILTIALDRPLVAGEERTLLVETGFSSRPNEPRLAHAPYIGANDAFTDLGSAWIPGMPYDTFAYDLRIECPSWMTAVGNGLLTEITPAADGARRVFHFVSARPMSLVNWVAGRWQSCVRQVGDMTFELLTDEGSDLPTAPALDDLARGYGFCARQFGGAGLKKLTLITAPLAYDQPSYNAYTYIYLRRSYFAFLGKSLEEGGPAWYGPLCHEISHCWWGYLAMSDILGNGGNWLREGLAEFSSGQALEERYGADYAAHAFRRKLLAGYFNDLRSMQGRREPSLVDVSYLSAEDISYEKGAWVFLMLRERLGTEAFAEVLHRYLVAAGKRFMGYRDFQDIAEEVHGRSLKDFFRAWVLGTGRVDLAVVKAESQPEGDAWVTEVTVANLAPNAFPVSAELQVGEGEGAVREVVACAATPVVVRVKSAARPERIELDAGWRVLDVERTNNSLPRGIEGGLVTHFLAAAAVPGAGKEAGRAPAIGVLWLAEGSPLARVGLRAGDVIIALDGRAVVGPEDFGVYLAARRAGDTVRIRYVRGTQSGEIDGKVE
ncbi:MAG: PDZ domain-containing protein [Planctomycetes bacterium]|nr:PDZ domain-containing protein [Planctomycetota bacterium]